MKFYIGIDLGGTNVRCAKIDDLGNVLQVVKNQSFAQDGPEKVYNNICSLIEQIDGYKDISGIGIGVPGPVDTVLNKMIMSTNLPGMQDFPLAKLLQDKFNVPVFLDNDANVAGLAEAIVGAGKQYNIVYYVTLSTGIGGALVVNDQLVSGMNGYAGEIGNLIIDRNRQKYNHLNIGAVENEASGTAITRYGKKLFPNDVHNAGDIFKKAIENEPQAIALVDQVTTDLAVLFSHIAHIVNPHCFVLGGGMMKSKEVFLPKTIEKFNHLVHDNMQQTKFLQATLEEPGIIGAAMLAKTRLH